MAKPSKSFRDLPTEEIRDGIAAIAEQKWGLIGKMNGAPYELYSAHSSQESDLGNVFSDPFPIFGAIYPGFHGFFPPVLLSTSAAVRLTSQRPVHALAKNKVWREDDENPAMMQSKAALLPDRSHRVQFDRFGDNTQPLKQRRCI
ncbi:hypothetical protein Nepgr_000041 [Nepenthes gracilis]|uniref:Uncharacterized protein n=1 Tax=Nepenthes gracilis TaxID=150966 RepID=A0AAD3RV93_NEPGR|nr:hypothetical protein Nepgr_000041 [Nepenthes gracilis]